MAATDTFDATVAALTESERAAIADFLKLARQQMQAARSEDARLRILENFHTEVHARLQTAKQAGNR